MKNFARKSIHSLPYIKTLKKNIDNLLKANKKLHGIIDEFSFINSKLKDRNSHLSDQINKNIAIQLKQKEQIDELKRNNKLNTNHLNSKINNLYSKIEDILEQIRKQGAFPAGHFYSPIPDPNDIEHYIKSSISEKTELSDINLHRENQFQILREYSKFYKECPFPQNRTPGYRYYYDQDWFCHSDAIFLYSFLRKNRPEKIVEVGSGFSSAVILDTVDFFFSERPEITFIEPFPERLYDLLSDSDAEKCRIINSTVQKVPLDVFTSLSSGDLLFIDSSHVLKCGSDLHFLLFEVLPRLPMHVFVHFHDIFFPFEYPEEWLTAGRYWNENYILRAFLSHNSEWTIYTFNSFLASAYPEFISENMPLCLNNPGGSLYIRRTGRS